MRINRIELFNIGSYEGNNQFDIEGQNEIGNVVLIGGKNGAGKTTLFTAIKLCLYGYKEAGYQSINAYYKRMIKKLINDKAKIENDAEGYVLLDISLLNGQEWDRYVLKRNWKMDSVDFEQFYVERNGIELDEEQIVEFENFLMCLIPPELFELYFFDGEQIADYFLEDSNNERIKKAFLTICGYDTFDILYKNFKRVSRSNSSDGDALATYLEAEDKLYEAEKKVKESKMIVSNILDDIEMIDSELGFLEKKYKTSGGVTLDDWNSKFIEIKTEERIREDRNTWLKNAANDMIPYIILRNELENLLEQMNNEQDIEKMQLLNESVVSLMPDILNEVSEECKELNNDIINQIIGKMQDRIVIEGDVFLNLSKGEYSFLVSSIMKLLEYDKKDIITARKMVKKSISKVQKIRKEIENSSIEGVDAYLDKKEKLVNRKSDLLNERDKELEQQKMLIEGVTSAQNEYSKASKNLEKSLKSQSVEALTAKSILFLEELQKRLFVKEIEKVEKLFMKKMKQLMRKEQFVDHIAIDTDFNVHVYKKVPLQCAKVCETIMQLSEDKYVEEYGEIHCKDLLRQTKLDSISEFLEKYVDSDNEINVLIEFDKSTMSKGEKQVFIMALYWAIVHLSSKEIPFIIDTPFARIDTEHRGHITKYFFRELSGQVFIFSTDEEITQSHMTVLEDKMQAQFLVENTDNTKTIIREKRYFGV